MSTKRVAIVVILTALGLLAAALRPAYTGPGVRGNLIMLEVAKARWLREHKGAVEQPTTKDLRTYLAGRLPRSVHGEIYIINKIGQPVYAYDQRTEALTSLDSNGLRVVSAHLEQ